MMNSPFEQSDEMPVYVISVAAELSGMHPQTLREYERRGVALIAPEAGIDRFFDELLRGSDPQVLLTAASAEVLT